MFHPTVGRERKIKLTVLRGTVLWCSSGVPISQTLSVTPGQCDARPTVIFAAAEGHRLTSTKLYCSLREAVCDRYPKAQLPEPVEVEPATC